MSSPTLKDIAQLAGVSTATASRVINGSHGGSLQVRTAVMGAVAALQYIPNPHATQLGRASGGRKRKRHKKGRREPDVMTVRVRERTMTQNADSSDLKSRILILANENEFLRRVVADLTSELRQTTKRTPGSYGMNKVAGRISDQPKPSSTLSRVEMYEALNSTSYGGYDRRLNMNTTKDPKLRRNSSQRSSGTETQAKEMQPIDRQVAYNAEYRPNQPEEAHRTNH